MFDDTEDVIRRTDEGNLKMSNTSQLNTEVDSCA